MEIFPWESTSSVYFTASVELLHYGPQKFLFLWLLHGLGKIHVLFVCIVHIGNEVTHLLLY